jgi:hypothetical protein
MLSEGYSVVETTEEADRKRPDRRWVALPDLARSITVKFQLPPGSCLNLVQRSRHVAAFDHHFHQL